MKTAESAIEFSTEMYEFAHGRKPQGIGCWAFQFGGHRSEAEFAPGTISLAEAKKWARARAASLGVYSVIIAS